MPKQLTFGDRLLLCRLSLGVAGATAGRTTQTDVAQALTQRLAEKGIANRRLSKVMVSRWESGKTEPSLAMIATIAEVFNCDLGWLAFGAGHGEATPLLWWIRSDDSV